eukprot:CAMPEP_0184320640 /NCGR_PEP_ID=MMETSP1049-20130417/114998_1 /TAXON_ID=77928 /ORGANISM="Proteomonas sulcata, Strain CCMP704" /LENGTH=73 /DNA_ID=CAMNT_0026641205 /DNA_START=2117 /DNA_END=2338 /DNA_ORIENTATION=+
MPATTRSAGHRPINTSLAIRSNGLQPSCSDTSPHSTPVSSGSVGLLVTDCGLSSTGDVDAEEAPSGEDKGAAA